MKDGAVAVLITSLSMVASFPLAISAITMVMVRLTGSGSVMTGEVSMVTGVPDSSTNTTGLLLLSGSGVVLFRSSTGGSLLTGITRTVMFASAKLPAGSTTRTGKI